MNIEVDDITFPTRFLSFMKDVEVNDCAGFEEREYLGTMARRLLDLQRASATDPREINYLKITSKDAYY